jgi:hypothetical protein
MRRVSFETSFDSKQPKLEPKLVSALSETKRLFRLFRFYTETAFRCFRLNQNKQKTHPNSLNESILWYFSENLGLFRFVLILVRNTETNLIRPKFFVFGFAKQTETNPKQILFRSDSVRTKIYFCLFRGHPSMRFFRPQIFHESVSPKPLTITFGPFQIFLKMLGNICSSRCTMVLLTPVENGKNL